MGCSCSRAAQRERTQSPTTTVAELEDVANAQNKRRRSESHANVAEECTPEGDDAGATALETAGGAAAANVSTAASTTALAQRLAYFDKKCMIRASLSSESFNGTNVVSSPGSRSPGVQDHHLMTPWHNDDVDIAANFWLSGPPPHQQDGWNELGDNKFADPVGSLTLSNKQFLKISAWKRVTELVVPGGGGSSQTRFTVYDDDGRVMRPGEPLKPRIMSPSPPRATSIRQGFVGDCSFLSSLASLAEYEIRSGQKVLESLLFPKDPRTNQPVINPQGMYACKLYVNGCHRKVIIDDFVPTKKDGRILSAHTESRRDLWVTLLEKSFIRLSGGAYYMNGSNPGADLFHLTGWIPETLPFKKELVTSGESGSPVRYPSNRWDAVWRNMYRGFRSSKCVVCLGTSDIPDSAPSGLDFMEGVSISSGIVARHAYGVINLVETTRRDGKPLRLVYVRNPWSAIRWKLAYSPGDSLWTRELEKECGYDSKLALAKDDGCFWITWEDIIRWFSHVYICWNHHCFRYRQMHTSVWGRDHNMQESILVDDSHLIAYNPQFRVRVQPVFAEDEDHLQELLAERDSHPEHFSTVVWFLLSRHLQAKKKDFFQRYIACHIHMIRDEEDERTTGSRRICSVPSTTYQGIYSNGECVIVRVAILRDVCLRDECERYWHNIERTSRTPEYMEHQAAEITGSNDKPLSAREFVLVVSQYGQKSEFEFTLRAHADVPVEVEEIPPLLNAQHWQTLSVKHRWTTADAGGCSNDLWDYFRNPHFRLSLPKACAVYIILECAGEASVGLRLFHGRYASARALRTCTAETSGSYRQGACFISTFLEAGEYTLIPSTFQAGECETFRIVCHVNLSAAETAALDQISSSTQLSPDGRLVVDPTHVFNPLKLCRLPYPFCRDPSLLLKREQRTNQSLYLHYTLKPLTARTWLSVRLQVHNSSLDLRLIPTITVSCLTPQKEEGLAIDERWQPMIPDMYVSVLSQSDIDGGLSLDRSTPSSAASRLYSKYGMVCLSCVTLYQNITYILTIATRSASSTELVGAEDTCSYSLYLMGTPNEVQLNEIPSKS